MSRPGTRLTRADSSDGRNTSMMEVSCDGRYQAAERRRGRCGEGFVLSVSRKGECCDAVAESFFATIKRELIDARVWPTREGLRRIIFEYIEGWYNARRLHSTLGHLGPARFETIHHNADRQAA